MDTRTRTYGLSVPFFPSLALVIDQNERRERMNSVLTLRRKKYRLQIDHLCIFSSRSLSISFCFRIGMNESMQLSFISLIFHLLLISAENHQTKGKGLFISIAEMASFLLGKLVCPSNFFHCDTHRCLSYAFVCNGEYNCHDQTDESNCSTAWLTHHHPCNTTRSISCEQDILQSTRSIEHGIHYEYIRSIQICIQR